MFHLQIILHNLSSTVIYNIQKSIKIIYNIEIYQKQ